MSRPLSRRTPARAVIALSSLALAATGIGLVAGPADANPSGSGLVIAEVYGGGGNSGATYRNDYVELYNPTGASISVDGWTVQYRSATGTSATITALSGSVASHGHYLVQEAAGTGGTTALPTPDATGTANMSATAGVVILSNGPTAITATGNLAGATGVVDAVGYGTTATSYEGSAPAPAPSNTTADARGAAGADTDSNSADFHTGAPSPLSSSGENASTPSAAVSQTIAQIQGTDTATSPDSGEEVETQGVVTADYASGGFNGFYLETGGAGGTEAQDRTPGASDAVFVYGSAAAAQVKVGDSVDVVGQVAEYQGETEIEYPTVTQLPTALPAVTPDQIPWSDLATDAQKEAHEGELMAPQGDFTVTDDYDTNFYGEIELAAGDQTLRQPTDVGPAGSQAAQDAAAYDATHAVFLDDGSSWTYNATSHATSPLPWLTGSPVSIGSQVTFHQPVVLDYRNSQWDLQPQQQVVGDGSAVATFSDMRAAKATPDPVGGEVKLATFNVENFFPTTGDQFVADNPGASCSTYKDKDGNEEEVDDCTFANGDPGPRGAATTAAFDRQLSKIVYGINHLGASIVSLEEIENAVKFPADIPSSYTGDPRDYAVTVLVDALNADAGAGTWAFVPSPAASDLPPTAEQDVIRTAFIYKPADVTTVGVSHVLTGDSDPGEPFSIAREPLAQGFKAAGSPDVDAFMVVANHMKSKGTDASGQYSDCGPGGAVGVAGGTDDTETTDPASDQGGFNCTRVHEVRDMWAWAQSQAQALNTDRVFLVGDFNAYDDEDPILYLKDQGFTDLAEQFDPDHSSYSYDGLEGSLDHVLASPAALSMVTGATIWQINAQESVGDDYSRYDYNVTDLFDANSPWYASDHDPEVVGLDLPRGPVASAVTAPPATAVFSKSAPQIQVAVHADRVTPTGTVTVYDGTTAVGTATLSGGSATVVLDEKSYKRGTYAFTIAYSGDSEVAPSSGTVTLTVTNPAGK